MSAPRIARSTLPSAVRSFSTSASRRANDAYIISAARTATGKFNGGLKNVPAPTLGSHVVKAALARANIPTSRVQDLYFGNVLQAGLGQSPARQVVVGAGLPETTEATTVNKVCASGLKAASLAAQNIQLGLADIQVAGGMESMSNVPYYLHRHLPQFGNTKMEDGLIKDGLWDVYGQMHMGNCAENTARRLGITREEQDEYAIESYRRAKEAWVAGKFEKEIVPITLKTRKGDNVVKEDEEYEAVKLERVSTLRPAFQREGGTITAANSSTFSDGASAVVIGSKAVVQEFGAGKNKGAVPARIVSYADAATHPIDFPLAPTFAIPLALDRAGLSVSDIAKWEINEAFAAVSKAIEKTLKLDASKVNTNGGAIALGHALGSSGTRILTSLLYQLKEGEFGVAAICNGGGGATTMVVQRVDGVA